MNNYELILEKIQLFTRKFYMNELLKGTILFLTIGLLYFIFTLFIEYFLWLTPFYRTILFWFFIAIEFLLLYKFILIPILKIFGLRKGIDYLQASRLIGEHFSEIDDKLLNMLQLHDSLPDSELVLASIDQKASNLKPFTFQNAIDFKVNKKYLKYLLIPISIWFLTYISGNNNVFSGSYKRLVLHQKEFLKPAPFSFRVLNKNLKIIEGNTIDLLIEIQGNTVPDEAFIHLDNESFFLQKITNNTFIYQIKDLKKTIEFYLHANEVVSNKFLIELIPTPQIQSIKLKLNYPPHLNKPNEIIENTGNAYIPEGTNVTWIITTKNTTNVSILDTIHSYPMNYIKKSSYFQLSKNIRNDFHYTISTSNSELKDYENLPFTIIVIKDAFPEIQTETDIDSLEYGEAHFVGRISDDYGLSKLQVVYYQTSNENKKLTSIIPIKPSTLTDFYFIFPNNLNLLDGMDYEFYFEIFDNDKVNGYKSTKSRVFSYHKDTELEFNEKLLDKQQDNINNISKLLIDQQKNQKELDALQKELQNKSEIKFNDSQQFQHLLKRQQQYEDMMQRKTEQLKQNFENQPKSDNKSLEEKKKDIQKKIEEFNQSEEQKKLYEELQKIAEKLKKEDLLDRLQKMNTNNKQKENTLEQLLELTKRFYVEQKLQQISEKLDELAQKQEDLKNDLDNSSLKQEEINKEFKEIQKNIDEMLEQNEDLKTPMPIDEQKPEQLSIEEDLKQAKEQLDKNQKQSAQKPQQSASKKMKEMSKSFQMQMQEMQNEMIEEDIASLRRVLENLIIFSFKQEELMNGLNQDQLRITNISSNLKQQNILKTYFEHIDDSLYTLSMRQPKMSNKINEYLANAHYYLNESNESLSENQLAKTKSNQQFVMTAANDLAYMLSNLLDNLQNAPPSFGQGSGKGQPSFSLPDIIQKQGDLKGQMESEMNKNGKEKPKNGKETSGGKQKVTEEESKSIYEMYQKQSELRQQFENQLENTIIEGDDKHINDIIKQMEQIEKILLEKGITNEVLQRITRMEQDLLQLKNASYEQGIESKRLSTTNIVEYRDKKTKYVEEFYKKLNQQELLNRNPFPFKPQINKKVINYFK